MRTALLLTLVLVACKEKTGTCLVHLDKPGDSASLEDECIIHEKQRVCQDSAVPVEFFAEDAEVGATRCRKLGFETKDSDAEIKRKLNEGTSVMYYHPKK